MLNLKKVLTAKGISPRACADVLGISEKSLYNKTVGDTEFTYGEARKLKALLPEYDLDYLLSEEAAIA